MNLIFNLNRLIKASFVRSALLVLAIGLALNSWADAAGQVPQTPETPADEHNRQSPVARDTGLAEQPKAKLPLDELRAFTEVMERIKKAYVEEVDDRTLLENAIQGMLSGLDPHSAYLKPDDFKELEENTSGEFGGLGIEVGMEDGFIKVVSPIDDTPAAKAGIQAGDLIIKLDNVSVKGMSLGESVDKMRGKADTPIKLTIVRKGKEKPLEITLKRAVIKVQSVRAKHLETGYGYIRVSQFQADTGNELVDTLKKLRKEQQDGKLHGLVLDLRNNPGGVLQAAVGVTDAFISEGLIVYTEGRIPNSELRFNASADDPSKGVPLVVLINGGSASASEIVAGALQDHKRAVLMGTESFGKGSVQTVLPLSVDSAKGLKLTTALYYTPNGRSIQAEGIKPDIVVQRAKVTPIDAPQQYKEADLQRHLDNGNKDDVSNIKKAGASKAEKELAELLAQDYQLNQALNVLKGMHINAITAGKSEEKKIAAKSDRKRPN
ncbi:S41 family peptidase [Endozoicomonas sp. SCSIO W0465]|uniref:S41 family peptidase n=1 Tax=Endozoicomonas sp. SCSIO W0465 TaxID=2918516 RepID=UPI002074D805|nr:S41 family peptidase [Endozoicomonas sp. SCSIO W0465]USE37029.1 S41 family peptidase [Endozoicomonas sp. SCSIO W0465]